jgi:hypothetical protein
MKSTEFSKSIHNDLKHYVYLYIDPRNNEIFYVGKGYGNRAFSHLKDDSESEKVKRIKEIRNDNLDPKIEILIHGIESDEIIKKIEASIIDLIGIDKLTNKQRGYESKDFGRMSLDQLYGLYKSEDVVISEPAILININKSFHYNITDVELYDATRSAWVVGINKEKAKYAFSVYEGIVQEVYEIKGWYLNNSTFNTRKSELTDTRDNRWEFVGKIATTAVRNKYRYKNVSKYIGPRNPINYANI